MSSEYRKLRYYLDKWFDYIVIFSILIVLWIGAIAIWISTLKFFGITLDIQIQNELAITTALSTIITLKTYQTLKLFVSTTKASIENIMELWLIGLAVKIFFVDSYLTRMTGGVFVIIFLCYLAYKIAKVYFLEKNSDIL